MVTFIVVLFCLCTHGSVAAAGGNIGCSIPSVKEGEQTTLTCSFHNVNVSDTTIIVNAKDVEIAHPESGGDLSVLFLTDIDQDKPVQVLDTNYQLLNFSVSGEDAELRILIPDAKRGYEGTYTCQAMEKDKTHTMQSCRFLLDRVTVDVLNSSSALVMMNDTTGDDNLMQAITVRREEMDQAPRKIDLSPPYYSYIVSALDENTQYELTVYMGQDRIPVDRSVCIPAVRNLTGQFVKQENRSVFLNWEPTTCSRGPLPLSTRCATPN
ncbi:uncharacterized protein [Littorina saxatilis]|uniref:Ig-like domain-containing protein n=1 Tax=Littorina saxatilis TaxID=31220 RepID=A0AAN9BJB3_9CAEN